VIREMDKERKDFKAQMELLYLKKLRELSGERRMEIASELFETVKEIAKAGIIQQNPGINEKELREALRKRIYG